MWGTWREWGTRRRGAAAGPRHTLWPMVQTLNQYTPGQRVRVTQQNPRLSGVLSSTVEGVIVRFGQQKTGSWFAHSKDDKFWLDRLEIRKDDGELVVLNLDQYSRVEPSGGPGASRK